jgi:hypothetical protein
MTERAVRCPYCVVGNDFRPMIALADGRLSAPSVPTWKYQATVTTNVIVPGASSSGRLASVDADEPYGHSSRVC